jgi:ethanolamine utilization protein EutQ
MWKMYRVQRSPFKVPTQDGKQIYEHFGLASTQEDGLSIAHMIAPPGWSEDPQTPEFDEYTIVIRGKKLVEVDGKAIELSAGHSICISRGTEVRYSNPFSEEVEYLAVCIPAFSIERAGR